MAELKVVTREAVWSELSDPIPTQYTQKNVEKKVNKKRNTNKKIDKSFSLFDSCRSMHRETISIILTRSFIDPIAIDWWPVS